MDTLNLNDTQSLVIESMGNRVRLVIYEHGMEQVCRKEYIRNIHKFFQLDNARLFSGRLQLCKDGDDITIQVKGNIAGRIKASDFLACLQKAKQAIK